VTRAAAIARALAAFDDGRYLEDLARRVAIPTESQNPERLPDLARYLSDEMVPTFEAMGFHKVSEHAHEGYDRPTFIRMRKQLEG